MQLSGKSFGAVTEYYLSANRSPAGFAVAQDGSVWFGEWGLPGLGHITSDGKLTEYRWPYADNSPISLCGQETQIWGVAVWNGTVWGADNEYSRLVSLDPSTGRMTAINLTSSNSVYPYTLSVGAGDLWFTDNVAPGIIGRITPESINPQYYTLPNGTESSSEFIAFQNDTRGYVLTANPVSLTAQIYQFNPTLADPSFVPLGQNQTLYEPSGLAISDGGIWATEHGASAMAFLNFTDGRWTIYPTSTVPYVQDVLTYFDQSNGSAVWFNEHYANRMGVISADGRDLTEYSITDPPIFNITTILEGYNMVTMGLGPGGAWFAATTAGIVGFVNASYVPPFSVSVENSSVDLSPGGSTQVRVVISGNTTGSNLALQFEDNEFSNSTAREISFNPGADVVGADGQSTVVVALTASSAIQTGQYVAAVTVTNGSIYRTAYFTVEVS